jgi:hypothetical protein
MKHNIRLRINRQRTEALHEICDEMLEEFKPVDAHHQLLKEYLSELREKLTAMLVRDQDLYTLMLTSAEALAFYQLWNLLDISHDKYATIIVDGLMRKMSRLAA